MGGPRQNPAAKEQTRNRESPSVTALSLRMRIANGWKIAQTAIETTPRKNFVKVEFEC